MFQFRRFPAYAYFVQRRLLEYCSSGFPHSEISGSKLICSSPKLIAAYHVLHRLLMPRHSPCALYSLTYRTILIVVLWFELCRLHKEVLWLIAFTLHLSVLFHNYSSFPSNLSIGRNLSVALLYSQILLPLFSFQGAIFLTL